MRIIPRGDGPDRLSCAHSKGKKVEGGGGGGRRSKHLGKVIGCPPGTRIGMGGSEHSACDSNLWGRREAVVMGGGRGFVQGKKQRT